MSLVPPHPSELALIIAARDGDDHAFTQLAAHYAPMLEAIAMNFAGQTLERDDANQLATLNLWIAMQSFNEHAGTPFGAFAAIVLKRRMGNSLASELTESKRPLREAVSLDDEMRNGRGPDPRSSAVRDDRCAAAHHQNDESFAALNDFIDNALRPEERDVLRMILDGHTYEDTARILGLNEKRVDNLARWAREKINAYLQLRDVAS